MSTTPVRPSGRSERLYDVDWLRALAVFAVIVYHSARLFDSMEPWHIKNYVLTDALTMPMALGSQFMMPLFFILSGISTRFALGSRPASDFAWKRFLRLGVPLVTLGWFVLSPPQVYIEAVSGQGYNAPPFAGSFFQFLPHYFTPLYGQGGYFALTGVHLWYLFHLLLFTLASLPLFLYLRSAPGRRLVEKLAGFLQRPGAILLLGLPLCLPELLLVPDSVLVLSWSEGGWFLATHWLLLVYGFVLACDRRIGQAIQRQRWFGLGLAAASLVPLVILAPCMGDIPRGTMPYFLQWGLRTVNGWFWLVAILGFGVRYLNRPHRLLAVIGPAVLPFYILHQPTIVVLGYFMREWPLGILPKYLLVVVLVFSISIGLYGLFVRRSRWLRFLFGMPPQST